MVAVYVHVYTSLINMVIGDASVIGDAIIGCNFCIFSLLKAFLDLGRN